MAPSAGRVVDRTNVEDMFLTAELAVMESMEAEVKEVRFLP